MITICSECNGPLEKPKRYAHHKYGNACASCRKERARISKKKYLERKERITINPVIA